MQELGSTQSFLQHPISLSSAPKKFSSSFVVSLILCFPGFPSICQYFPSYIEFSFTCYPPPPPHFEYHLMLKLWSSIPPCDNAVGEALVIRVSLDPDHP